jgi:hypothetical protein
MATVRALQIQPLVLVHDRPNLRELVDVVAYRPEHLREAQILLALLTAGGSHRMHVIYMVGHRSLMSYMPGLAAPLSTPSPFALGRSRPWQIR